MKRYFLILFYFLFYNNIFSNNIYLKNINNITVIHQQDTLMSPFVGGLTSVQVFSVDMQNDGLKDWLIYDLYSNRIIIYKSINSTKYILDTIDYVFPNLNNWIEIFDYNCDQIPDLFTYNNAGSIEIFKGNYQQNKLQFTKQQNQINTQSFFGNQINVYATAIDKPSFADINSDGDIDVIGFNVFSNKLVYYENQKLELNLPCDSFFCRINDFCWGNFSEASDGSGLILKDTCSSKFISTLGQNAVQHNGANVSVADINGDGKIDALIGDLFFNNLTYLQNVGTNNYASFLTQTKNFPPQKNIAIDFLPLAQFVDINQDNKKDLIVSNFSYTSSDANHKNIWYYKNISNNNIPNFQFVEDDFILKDIIDVGRNSHVALVDINQDNVLDLLISNGGQQSTNETEKYSIRYYKNIGTNNNPTYELIDTNFLNIMQHQLTEIALASGDIDNDDDIDLVAGTHDGKIVWWQNNNGNYTYQNNLLSNSNITDTLGKFLVPCIYDIDNDNVHDLLVGNQIGKIIYLKGINSTQPTFQVISNSFANIHTINTNEIFGYAAPIVVDLDNNQINDLLIGTHTSGIWYYKDFTENYNSNLQLQKIPIPNFTKLTLSTFNNKLYVGNAIGGVSLYQIDTNQITNINTPKNIQNLNIYPNPTKNKFFIQLEHKIDIDEIKIYNVLSEETSFRYIQNGTTIQVELLNSTKGFYIIQLTQNHQTYIGKLLID